MSFLSHANETYIHMNGKTFGCRGSHDAEIKLASSCRIVFVKDLVPGVTWMWKYKTECKAGTTAKGRFIKWPIFQLTGLSDEVPGAWASGPRYS